MQADEYFMDLALAEAQQAFDIGEVPIGCVIVHAGQIIASAHNRRETGYDATAHAEIIAIRQACQDLQRWRLTGCTLYVTIEPCPMCAGALVMSRIDRLVYGSADAKAGAVDTLFNIPRHPTLNHNLEICAGVRSAECSEIMKQFFRLRRHR